MEKMLNNEMIDSAKKAIRDKLESSFYGIFVIYWLIFHWRFVYSAFFVSEDIIWNSMKLLKSDYLVYEFFKLNTFSFWFWLIAPAVLTFLTIWFFPKWFIIPAYKKEQGYEYEKAVFKIEKQIDLEKKKTDLEKQESTKLDVIAEKIEKEKKIKDSDETDEWEKEYQNLKKKNIFSHFRALYQIIYENGGATYGQQSYQAAKPLLAYLSTIEVLELHNNHAQLTSKGRFFMRKYLEEVS